MDNEKVTIVVPVYNVENYLKQCIDSILGQTYENFELILVDDGSTDQSDRICDEYEKKDERIKVIHKKNGGLSDARNKGIEIATGKYITFVDSDDFIKPDYVEYLYGLLKKYNTSISICAYTVLMENGKKIDYGKNYSEALLTTEQCFDRMLCEIGFSVSAWAKLYDIKLFEKVRYPYGKLCEDNGTTYKLIDQVEKIAYGNQSKYYYLKRKGSIMLSEFNLKKMDMIELTDEMCDYLQNEYSNIIDSIERRRFYARFNVLRQLLNSSNKNKDLENEIIQWILNRKKIILTNPKSSMRDKIALICLMLGKNFFNLIWGIYTKIKY